jgi:hypothetical protein
MADDDEQKDDHNDDPNHPAFLEKGYREIKLWQMMNRQTIAMTILTIQLSWKKVTNPFTITLNFCGQFLAQLQRFLLNRL